MILGEAFTKFHMLLEGLFHLGDGYLLPVAVPVHHPVKAHADVGKHVASQRNIGMQGTGSADPEDIEGAVLRLYLAGFEIHIGQGVQLCHHDVYIVGADSVGQGGDALSLVLAGNGNELTVRIAALDVREMVCQDVYTAGVSHHDHIVCQLFRLHMEVKDGSVSIDDKFRFGYFHVSSFSRTNIRIFCYICTKHYLA